MQRKTKMRFLSSILSLFFSGHAVSCPTLMGTWKSSKELSMDYNEKYANLDNKQHAFLDQIFGHAKFTYAERHIHQHSSPMIHVLIDGQRSDFHFDDLNYPYKILSCSETSAKIKSNHPHSGPTIAILNFVDEDTYWVSPETLPSTREYFIRVQ